MPPPIIRKRKQNIRPLGSTRYMGYERSAKNHNAEKNRSQCGLHHGIYL
jgi:hypothetical protein